MVKPRKQEAVPSAQSLLSAGGLRAPQSHQLPLGQGDSVRGTGMSPASMIRWEGSQMQHSKSLNLLTLRGNQKLSPPIGDMGGPGLKNFP